MPGWPKTPEDRRRDSQRYGTAWRKARKAALERAGRRCEQCGSRTGISVDHIYGAGADPGHQHLRVLCGSCHRTKSGREGAAARNGSRTGSADPEPQPRTDWTR